MALALAAILERDTGRWRRMKAALTKAGLRVTPARTPQALTGEAVVVVGPAAGAAKVAAEVRARLPRALLLAALARGFTAAWADAVLPLPVSVRDLKVRLLERQDAAARPAPSGAGGLLDPVTSFYAYASFRDFLHIEVKRARRYGFPLAAAMVAFDPVDGELDPDLVEQLMSGLSLAIRRALRDTDFPVQLSPDRVLLLMPHTDLAGAVIVARRIIDRVSRATLTTPEAVLHPTISVGVTAETPGTDFAFDELLRRAAAGLDAAQAQGGNRSESYTGPVLPGSAPRFPVRSDGARPAPPPPTPLLPPRL